MSVRGYIEYTNSSPLSPSYPHPITIPGITQRYESPVAAIEDGIDPMIAMISYVSQYRSLYLPYVGYVFKGLYAEFLNRAIDTILSPGTEGETTGWYQYIVETIPSYLNNLTTRVQRNVYITRKVGENLYQQIRALGTTEVYSVYRFPQTDYRLYIGKQGAFILFENLQDQDRVVQLLS